MTVKKLKRVQRDPLVPRPKPNYVNRTVEGGVADFDLFDYAMASRFPVLIEGPTGCGKTMAVEAYAGYRKLRFQSISCNAGVDPSQFWGRVIPQEDGTFRWQDGIVTDMARHGGVLLFNEINFLPERISTALFPLFDGRRTLTLLDHTGEVVHAHDSLLLVADMNPGYLGTRPLNAAFRNRQTIQTIWNYDPEVEAKLVPCDALRTLVAQIRDSETYETPVSTNMMMEFLAHAVGLGMDYARENFVNHFATEERMPIRQVLATYAVQLEEWLDSRSGRVKKNLVEAAVKTSNDPFQFIKEV